jgi:polysaccharide chain length determinant protein (PEP-CTERM system associated)
MLPGKKYAPADTLDILRRSWGKLVVPILACTFGALVVSALLPNVYESDMLVQIIPQRVPDTYVKSTVTLKTEDRLNAVAQQVMSRTQLEQVIKDFNLYPNERQRLPMEDVVDKMRLGIAPLELVRRAGSTSPADAFHVRFRYPDAEMATRVTQRLGTLFIDNNARDRGSLADATNQFLETQLQQASERLDVQERRLELFRQQHAGRLPSNLDFNMQAIQSSQMQVQSLVESLARDRDRKLMLERLYGDAVNEPRLMMPAPVNTATGQASPNATPRQQLVAARAQLAALLQTKKPDHPDVGRAQRTITELEARVAKEPPDSENAAVTGDTVNEQQRRDRLQQWRAEIESLDRQIKFKENEENNLRKRVSDYQGRIEAVPSTESEWMQLTRDYDTLQTAYKGLLAKSEESKVAADLERRQIGEQFRVLDAARVPNRPVSPNRLLVNGVGLGIGVALGVLLVALTMLRDTTFRTETDIAQTLALPVLAMVPYVESDEDKRKAQQRKRMKMMTIGVATTAAAYVFWTMELWKHVV